MSEFKSQNIIRKADYVKKKSEGSTGEWVPDENFRKADFPGKADRKTSVSGVTGGKGERKSSPAIPVSSKKPVASSASFPVISRQEAMAEHIQKSTTTGNNEKQTKRSSNSGWAPPRVDREDSRVISRKKSEQDIKSPENTQSPVVKRSGDDVARRFKNAMKYLGPDPVVKDAILAAPLETVNRLRGWYWEKEGHPPDGLIGQVPPATRIFIILVTAGKPILEKLYSIMTPTERRQFNDLLKQPPKLDGQMVSVVRRGFLESILY